MHYFVTFNFSCQIYHNTMTLHELYDIYPTIIIAIKLSTYPLDNAKDKMVDHHNSKFNQGVQLTSYSKLLDQ